MLTAAEAPSGLDLRRPFTRADAVAAGLDPRLLRGSRFRRIFRGVYVSREVPDSPFLRTQAAVVLHPPSAFASHLSAARIYRLPVPASPCEHVTVREPSERRTREGVVSHVASRCSEADIRTHRLVRLSEPFRMFVELAAMLSLLDLVVVGDAMLKVFEIRATRLVEECRSSTDRYAAAARRAAAFVRNEVDSPMETRLRMLIVLAGLPEPKVNHKIRDEHGNVVIRLDLCYPELRLIIEYDGRQHAEDVGQWNRDLERREILDEENWRILVVTAKGIYSEPARTLDRIHRALLGRGCVGLVRRLREDWCPYFPGRS